MARRRDEHIVTKQKMCVLRRRLKITSNQLYIYETSSRIEK